MLNTVADFINDLSSVTGVDYARKAVGKFLSNHHTTYKVVVYAWHQVRMIGASVMMHALHYPRLARKMAVLAAGSLAYAISIEANCAFTFAIPSCLGAFAKEASKDTIAQLINKMALDWMTIAIGIAPIIVWNIGVLLLTHAQVKERLKASKARCCG